jgi:hypothetical protein
MPDQYDISGRVSLTPADDEDDEKRTPGRPNAWWAAHKDDVTETSEQARTFDSSFRGVPTARHGGEQTVHEVAGSLDYCWCGQPFDHPWPGKDKGRKHPKEGTMSASPENTRQRIERRQLRAYHDDLVDVITEAVNGYGARYRMQKNGVLLFPPDGTTGITINARNDPRQVKSARLWFLRHCVGVNEEGRATNPLVEDPQVLADDHQRRLEQLRVEDRERIREQITEAARRDAEQESSVTEQPVAPSTETLWVPYVNRDEVESEFFETDGHYYRCKVCLGTEREYVADNTRGLGGHIRMNHRDTDALHNEEAREKAFETRQLNRMTRRVEEALTLLNAAVGKTTADPARIKQLEEENRKLRERAEEAETRLALMREALGA